MRRRGLIVFVLLLSFLALDTSPAWAVNHQRHVYVHQRSKKKQAAIIGGSAAGGALIGGLAGGGKGALIGGLVGGAGGAVYNAKTRKKRVVR